MPEKDSDGRQHLSYSGLRTLLMCGISYEKKYLDGIRLPWVPRIIRGAEVHNQRERNFKTLLQDGDLPPMEQVKDEVRDAVDGAFRTEVAFSAEEMEQGVKAVEGETLDHAIRLAAEDRAEIQPTVVPLKVEHKFKIRLPDNRGLFKGKWDIVGRMDLVQDLTDYPAIDPEILPEEVPYKEKLLAVRECKTKVKSPSKTEADQSTQLSIYDIAIFTERGRPADALFLDSLVALKRSTKHVSDPTARMPEDRQRALRRIVNAIQGIEAGIFYPAPEDHWKCSANYCGFWSQCAFGGKGRARPKS